MDPRWLYMSAVGHVSNRTGQGVEVLTERWQRPAMTPAGWTASPSPAERPDEPSHRGGGGPDHDRRADVRSDADVMADFGQRSTTRGPSARSPCPWRARSSCEARTPPASRPRSYAAPRSTWWISTSRSRDHITRAAGASGPPVHRTITAHAPGASPSIASANRLLAAVGRRSGRRRPANGPGFDVTLRCSTAVVLRRDDARTGPGQQVDRGVGIAGDVGEHVAAGPAGQA